MRNVLRDAKCRTGMNFLLRMRILPVRSSYVEVFLVGRSAASDATSDIIDYCHHLIPNSNFYDPNKRCSQREAFTPAT
jgi:hypothetical protein